VTLIGMTCLRCDRTFVPDLSSGPCPKAPDGGPHEVLPNPFLPRGFPPQEDYEWRARQAEAVR